MRTKDEDERSYQKVCACSECGRAMEMQPDNVQTLQHPMILLLAHLCAFFLCSRQR